MCSGTLDDSGGPSATYSGNEDYTYTIAPVFAASVTMNFSAFDLENGFDSLYIYDGPSTASSLIGGYTGTTSPGTVTANSGAMTLHFVSDPFVNNAGFSSAWSCVQNVSVEENENDFGISVYPNPTNDKFTVYSLQSIVSVLDIYDIFGKKVFETTVNGKQETVNLNLPSGIYFLKVKTEKGERTLKLVKE
jgi:hypothetical protein